MAEGTTKSPVTERGAEGSSSRVTVVGCARVHHLLYFYLAIWTESSPKSVYIFEVVAACMDPRGGSTAGY